MYMYICNIIYNIYIYICSPYIYKHIYLYIYVHVHTHTCTHTHIHNLCEEEAKLPPLPPPSQPTLPRCLEKKML